MLKEKYTQITFPFTDKTPSGVLSAYVSEFGRETLVDAESISYLYLHVLRDFLEAKLDEWAYGSFCFAIMSEKKYVKLMNSLPAVSMRIAEGVDISWLAQSPVFPEYLAQLKKFLNDHLAV